MTNTRIAPLSFSLLLALGFNTFAETPHWIWHENHGAEVATNEVCFLRKNFSLAAKPNKALLSVAVGGEAAINVNGRFASHGHAQERLIRLSSQGEVFPQETNLVGRDFRPVVFMPDPVRRLGKGIEAQRQKQREGERCDAGICHVILDFIQR